MKFGVQVNCYRTTWDDIRTSIETLEAGLWNSLWFADHFLPPPGRREDEHFTAFEACP
jgi:alkanesulfonate monooxygenase SsuD/methylene tetrahydromethanopterin reductase-like flavin-dependent oxidoreductase (luciferase family)